MPRFAIKTALFLFLTGWLALSSDAFLKTDSQLLELLGTPDLKTLALSELVDVWLAFEVFGNTTAATNSRTAIRAHLGWIKTWRVIHYLKEKYAEDPLVQKKLGQFETDLSHDPHLSAQEKLYLFWRENRSEWRWYLPGWLADRLLARFFREPR